MDEPEKAWAENQMRFLDLLSQLTKAGRAEWFQVDYAPGYVHCLVDREDFVEFECRGGEKGDVPVPPAQPLAGVVAHHCNTTFLWLTGLANWDLLLELLRSAKFDEEQFRECSRIAARAPVRVLEARLKILS